MEIKRGNTVVSDVYLKDNSYVTEEVMGEHTLSLSFLWRHIIDLHIGDYVEFEGNAYKIRHNEKVTKRETSLGWEYNVTFYASRYDLEDVEFFLHGSPERKKNFDYYTGTAQQWLDLMVKNMNRSGSGWMAGSCIESRAITLSFKDKKVGSVLDEIAKELDTEYWIHGKTINIGRREYASNGLVLGQGQGMGFTELEVSAVDDAPPVTVLYPYGSDRNLGRDYGNDYLVLPGGRKSLEENVDKYGRIEQSKQFEHIFPKGEFTVTEKIDTCTLRAAGMDFNLKDCLLDGVEVIVTFQDGGLAGYDLAIVEDSWDNEAKQFKLKENAEENALKVPGDINFSVGDRFILTGLKMPQSYIDKAEQQLLKEATAWLGEHSEKRIQLRGKCDEVVFRLQNLFIACGQMVGVYSEELKIDREIRVTKVKRYIENDGKPCYRYELTLSDFLQGNGFKDMVDDVQKVPEEIEGKVKPVREWTKRSWRDVMETLGMMFDPEGDYFTEFIKPLAIHTAQFIVGTNSQQMDLLGVRFIPNADNDPNYFKSTAGRLVHFTVREDGVAEWQIPASAHRLNNAVAYYVYAKCSKTSSEGSILLSERQIKLEEEAGYYHFLISVLNTPEENVRSWNPNYGYTEIAGQTITTGVIKDKLSRLVVDLTNTKIIAKDGATIEGCITFGDGSSGLDNVAEWPAAQQEIRNAQTSADTAKQSVTSLNTYVDGAFKDGIITEAEAKAIEKYLNTVKTAKADVEATYNKLYANAYLSGTAKSGLLNAKVTLFGAVDNLFSSINTAIADGKTTVAEKNDVDSKFAAFNSALSSFYTAVETANQSIQAVLKGYSDTAYRKGQDALSAAEAASNEANKAQSSASNAKGIADSKAQIFYSRIMPSAGKENDLWVDGVNIHRFNGKTWEFHSLYDAETRINKGLITTGAIAVGPDGNPTGGIAGSGSIRIWAGGGGCNSAGIPSNPTFQVTASGEVMAKKAIKLQDNTAGISGDGTDPTSIRFWAGDLPERAPFRVNKAGELTASKCKFIGGTIAGFTIEGSQISCDRFGGVGWIRINNTGGLLCQENYDRIANFGPSAVSVASGSDAMVFIKNTLSSKNDPIKDGILIDLNGATDSRYLICRFNTGSAYREAVLSVKHFSNDASWAYRTCLKMSHMPHWSNLDTVTSNRVERQVMWDETTGMLYYK